MSELAQATTATIVPTLRYQDAHAAIEWLERAFGFHRHFVVEDGEGGVAHAQLTFGNGMIMLSSAHDDEFGQMQRPLASTDAPVSQSRTSSSPTWTPTMHGRWPLAPWL